MLDKDYEPLSKQWRFTEHWSGERAKYQLGSYSAFVQDMDGDDSWWSVKRSEVEIASGYERTFDLAILAVETVLIDRGRLWSPEGVSPGQPRSAGASLERL